jgi:hypothetical protein
MATRPSQGRQATQKESQRLNLLLVQASHVLGRTQRKGVQERRGTRGPAKRWPFYICSLRCICHSWKLRLEQSPRQHAYEHGGRMTRPTGMDFLVDHILVTVHGRGQHRQCTARYDLHPTHVPPVLWLLVWISPHDHHHSTLRLPTVKPTSPTASPFPSETPQEETLQEVSFAGKACIET